MDTTKIYTPRFTLPHVGRRLSLKSQKSVIETLPLLTDALKFERDKRAAENSLYEFVKQAWHVVEPGVEFSEGWHLKAICDHLEAVQDRRIRKLLINVPPRHSKSLISAVIFPVWCWLKDPTEKFLTASYSASLSTRDAVKSRRLLQSQWFKDRWPNLTLLSDQNTKQRYENEFTGYRIATSVGSTTTGEGGTILLCLHGDTLLECNQGQLSIRDIVQNCRDVLVAGYDHVTGAKVFCRILRYDENPGKKLLQLTTATGLSVKLTEDHPVFVIGKGYVPASEVMKNDRVLCSVQQGVKPSSKQNCKSEGSSVRQGVPSQTDGESCCKSSVCGVREGSKENASASISKRDGYMLLQKMLRKVANWFKQPSVQHGLQAKSKGSMRDLREGTDSHQRSVEQIQAPVLLGMSFGTVQAVSAENCANCDQDLPCMREGVFWPSCNDESTNDMQQVMRGETSQQANLRGRQWALRAWKLLGKISAGISTRCGFGAGEGQSRLSDMRSAAGRAPCSTSCTSHRLCEDQQRHEQFDNTLPVVSWGDARQFGGTSDLFEDVVEEITSANFVSHVYNLEIEHTHNYFANGVLLHNCDDAHGAQEAQSDTMRENTLEWLDMAWSTRKNDPRSSCEIMIMQRLHDMDAAGHMLKQGGWEHLCLPAEYDGVKRKTKLGYYDPRTEMGELLWPNRFGRTELDALKKALGSAYAISGQLQQCPAPEGGGILKTEHVQLWPAHKTLPPFQYITLSYDTAFTEKTTGDPTGCIVGGVFEYAGKQNLMILDVWTEHLAYPDLKERVMDDWKSLYGGSKDNALDKGRRPDIILVEAKASGQSLLQDLRQSNIPARAYNPGRSDKVQRAHIMAPILESDCIWVLESKKNPREPISWVRPMLENWAKFPVVAHDELTDCATQMVIFLKDSGWLDVPVHEDDEPDRYSDDDLVTRNPYAV